MIYKICESTVEDNGLGCKIEISGYDIPKKVFDDYFKEMKFLVYFKQLKFYKKMIEYNGITLIKYLKNNQLNEKESITSRVELANKYVYDLAGSFVSFVEYIQKRVMPKQSKEMLDEFEKFRTNLFDNEYIYRFWYYMRNYTTHYDVAFNKGIGTFENEKRYLKIVCEKEHLLQYREWKHSKEDIKNMEEEINIMDMIEPLLVLVNSMYLYSVYVFKNVILDADKYTAKFLKQYNIKNTPVFMLYEKEEDMKTKPGKITPLQVSELWELIMELKDIPYVNLTIKKE